MLSRPEHCLLLLRLTVEELADLATAVARAFRLCAMVGRAAPDHRGAPDEHGVERLLTPGDRLVLWLLGTAQCRSAASLEAQYGLFASEDVIRRDYETMSRALIVALREGISWLTPEKLQALRGSAGTRPILEDVVFYADCTHLPVSNTADRARQAWLYAAHKRKHSIKALVACAWNGRIFGCALLPPGRGSPCSRPGGP